MGAMNDPYFDELSGEKPAGGIGSGRPRRGCLFYGCIGVLVLCAVAGVLLVILAVSVYQFGSRLVVEYTATAPEPVPVVELPAAQVEAIEERVGAFQDAGDAGRPATLSLTAEELNALIARNPHLRGRVAVAIEGDQLRGRLSLPLEQLGVPDMLFGGLKGRYLNGEARFVPILKDDSELAVRIDELIVKGRPVPEEFLEELRDEELTIEFGPEDEDKRAFLRRLESIEVRDGKLILQSREVDEEEAADAADAPAETPEQSDGAGGEPAVLTPPDAPPPPDPPSPELR